MAAKHPIQEFDGRKYYFKREGYYKADFLPERRTRYMHRDVWEFHNGPIPAKHDVHHRNGDKADNRLDNLELLHTSEHHRHHMLERIAADPAANARALDAARVAAAVWHGSDEGREWHRGHARRIADAQVPVELVCEWCDEKYLGHLGKRKRGFCSPSCQGMARKASGVDDETRQCSVCGEDFRANKYGKKKTCSETCWKDSIAAGHRLRAQR